MDKDNLINPILKPENDQSNWKQWQKDLPNQFLNMDNSKKDDPVNHPSHYTDGKIEVIDFIEDKKLGFHLGNAVKYISRAGKKDPGKEIEDLEKAVWYVNRRIEVLRRKNINLVQGYPAQVLDNVKKFNIDDFDTKYYAEPDKLFTPIDRRAELEHCSELITSMTLNGANYEELRNIVMYSMVVIDAEKHRLNWPKAKRDFKFNEMIDKYGLMKKEA